MRSKFSSIASTPMRLALKATVTVLAAIALLLGSDALLPQTAQAYPFWAQQNYESPREATGRIVCANCHLAAKPVEIEVPQSVLPDSVFKAVVKIPYDTSIQQVTATGDPGPLNVGAVLMLPEGFQIAPEDRIPEEMKEEVAPNYVFMSYAEGQDNTVLVGPLPGDQYQEIVFPVLSPDPATDSSINFGKYAVHLGGNRGRGQVYPTGENSNNTDVKTPVSGMVTDITPVDSGMEVTIQPADGDATVVSVPVGPQVIVAVGDEVTAGKPITDNPNVGGFGQEDVEIVLQSPNRVKGLLAFTAAVMISQIMLVLKKKQVERVQEAEMSF
ncbi:cytochrome f [Vacuolonema iberomarrocanum]|uniref:cytochrome f n=1 Tax=Vacuolonema iberomarrocanum TaxID=3454632 RepID=UPI0019F84A28|nr:apocytochrome f [filamentous cyanobacterium LEGE 07170]